MGVLHTTVFTIYITFYNVVVIRFYYFKNYCYFVQDSFNYFLLH